MRVLITAASRHGATTEVAQAIAGVLSKAGFDTSVHRPEDVDSVESYDVVVLGSAIYLGRWLSAAKDFARRNAELLAARSVWLFSTGPVGATLPTDEPADVAAMQELTGARDHRLFGGRLDRDQLGLTEKAIVRLVGASSGDDRPWEDIEAWATGIARALGASLQAPAAVGADMPA